MNQDITSSDDIKGLPPERNKEKLSIDSCHPAILVIHPDTPNLSSLPNKPDISETVISTLENNFKESHSFVIDVREGKVEIQDEVPPADPIEWNAIIIVFDQVQATITHGYDGPFRTVMKELADKYTDLELWIDAVPGRNRDK